MKKLALIIFSIIMCASFTACADNGGGETKPLYTVTFDTQGGSEVESQRAYGGNPIRRPDVPARTGYFLNGWYTKSTAEQDDEWNFDTDRVTSDMTLYAGWSVVSSEPTGSLVYKREGNAYTVIKMDGEQTVVVIPAEYDGLPVTKIQGEYGTGAFARKKITSVTIPDSIVEIGQNAFYNCGSLRQVIIGTGSKLTTIGNNAFSGNSSLEEMFLPAGTVNLGDAVFNNCGEINRFIVAEGNSVYKSENGHLIEEATATLIRGANNKVVPEGVTVIASAAFRRSAIAEIELPSSVESIGNYVIADSQIELIRYHGTEEQWVEVTKAKLWNLGKKEIDVVYEPQIMEEITQMYLTINGNKLTVKLAENKAVDELTEILKKGDISYYADDYGGFEKVGSLGRTLTASDTRIVTEPGDVMLYNSKNIVLFYGSNTWQYTRIGKIEGYSASELSNLFGAGKDNLPVTLSLK